VWIVPSPPSPLHPPPPPFPAQDVFSPLLVEPSGPPARQMCFPRPAVSFQPLGFVNWSPRGLRVTHGFLFNPQEFFLHLDVPKGRQSQLFIPFLPRCAFSGGFLNHSLSSFVLAPSLLPFFRYADSRTQGLRWAPKSNLCAAIGMCSMLFCSFNYSSSFFISLPQWWL